MLFPSDADHFIIVKKLGIYMADLRTVTLIHLWKYTLKSAHNVTHRHFCLPSPQSETVFFLMLFFQVQHYLTYVKLWFTSIICILWKTLEKRPNPNMKLKEGIKSFTVKTIPFLFKKKNKSQVSSIPNKIKLTFKNQSCTHVHDRLTG